MGPTLQRMPTTTVSQEAHTYASSVGMRTVGFIASGFVINLRRNVKVSGKMFSTWSHSLQGLLQSTDGRSGRILFLHGSAIWLPCQTFHFPNCPIFKPLMSRTSSQTVVAIIRRSDGPGMPVGVLLWPVWSRPSRCVASPAPCRDLYRVLTEVKSTRFSLRSDLRILVQKPTHIWCDC